MARLSDEEKARRKAAREAEQAQRIKEWAEKVAAEAPPLQPWQIDLIAGIFRSAREDAERAKTKPPLPRQGPPAPTAPDYQI